MRATTDVPAAASPGVPDPALGEYTPLGNVALSDRERWPTLRPDDAARLDALRHHPSAPAWVHATGDRLEPTDMPLLDDLARELEAGGAPPLPALPPTWVRELIERAHAVVPRYRRARDRRESDGSSPLHDLVPVTRDDLRRDIASFVPVDIGLDRVLEGTSSGSTGAAIIIPLHPVAVAADLVLLRHLVGQAGGTWEADPDRLGLMNLLDQRVAFTYASAMTGFRPRRTSRGDTVSTSQDQTVPMMARVNLDAGAWRAPGDRERFLSWADPQVISSSPLPLLALAELARDADLALSPRAIVNGAAHLTATARARLQAVWPVPLIDLYGLRETGAVASRTDGGPFVVVPRQVWVEVLDEDSDPIPDGQRGEVVVTVDENPYLPLLRYRTGDFARLVRREDGVVELHDLEGRSPVRYQRADGAWAGSVDATQLLQSYGMAAWQLHQRADGAVELAVVPDRLGAGPGPGPGGAEAGPTDAAQTAADAVGRWLGRDVDLTVVGPDQMGRGRARRFSSDVPGGQA